MAAVRLNFAAWLVVVWAMASCELLQNANFDNGQTHWDCWGMRCEVLGSSDSHQGSHALRTHSRTHYYQGPSQAIHTEPGKDYHAESWIKILNDLPGTLGQKVELEVSFNFPDDSNRYINVAMWPMVKSSDGWIKLQGEFQAPHQAVRSAKFYYQGPKEGVDFAVDQASITEVVPNNNWRRDTDAVIEKERKSDIHLHVTTTGNIDRSEFQIQVLQTNKSFPFGMVVNSGKYVDPNQQKYRDFLHNHFNWAVQGNALKWRQFDWHQASENPGDPLYPVALNALKGLKAAGLKLRGHNMVWSVEQFIPNSVKAQSGDQLKTTVRNHINYVMNVTKGYLEHWDVNNENLHGQWFQEQLNDRDYDLELFLMMYEADHYPKLFLNDYNVVAQGAATSAYVAQAKRFKNAANVHLGGIGVQTHFGNDQEPNPKLIKQRLDLLAAVGVPIWVTELTLRVTDENKRADYFEKALRALYGHPAVEGIMFWGFWDNNDGAGALATGPNLQLTAAGRRVLDLLENQWMTDETFPLSQSGNTINLRGFRGDYEVRVTHNGHELRNLRKTFTLGTSAKSVNVNVHQ